MQGKLVAFPARVSAEAPLRGDDPCFGRELFFVETEARREGTAIAKLEPPRSAAPGLEAMELEALRAHAAALELANEDLRRADRLKDEFLTVVNYELRTSLSVILGLGSMLEDGAGNEQGASHHASIAKIVKAAERMHELVEDLLDPAAIVAGWTEPSQRQSG